MRKPVLLLAALLLLSAVGSATVTIEQPEFDLYTQIEPDELRIDTDESGEITWELNGEDMGECDCVDSSRTVDFPQGENEMLFYVDGDLRNQTRFTIDTLPPNITDFGPTGRVFTLNPTLFVTYDDGSDIATEAVQVSLNGSVINESAGERSFTADLQDLDEGPYTVTATIPDEYHDEPGNHVTMEEWTFTLPVEPVVSGRAPTGTVGADPTLRLTARDPSDVTPADSSIRVTNGNETREIDLTGEPAGTIQIMEQLSDLADGTYTVNAAISDTNENLVDESWTFTVDTTPPTVEIVSPGAGSIMTGDERVRVDASDALSEVVRVTVSIGNVTAEATERDDGFAADIDTTEVVDGEHAVRATAVDAAGNERTVERRVTVDNNAPAIENISLYPDPVVDGVLVEADAVDAATDVRGVRYTLEPVDGDESLASGPLFATIGEYDSRDERVRATPDLDLASGQYHLFLRTYDAAGHTSAGSGKTFTVDQGVAPELAVNADGPWTVVAGGTNEAAVHVANTGDADEYVRAEVESDLNVSVIPHAERVQEGENRTLTVRLAAGDAEPGAYGATVTLDGLTDDATVDRDVVVQPPAERRSEIEARYDELRETVASLNASLQETDIDDENVTERFDRAAAAVAEAEALLEEGRYSAAAEQLDVAGDLVETTESTFTAEVTRVRIATATSLLLRLGALLAVLGLFFVGYLLVPPEEGFDAEQGFVHRPEGKHPLRVRAEYRFERLKEKLRGGDAEQGPGRVDGWSGFGG